MIAEPMYRFLSAIGEWLKGWLPPIASIVWGIWLFFQWRYGELQRQKKEVPSLDGRLSATMIPCENGRLLVTVEALWNNHSPLSVYLYPDECQIEIFRIDSSKVKENAVVEFEGDLGELICTHRFLKSKFKHYCRIEPNTVSTFMNHFILQPEIYGIRMKLLGTKDPIKKKKPIKKTKPIEEKGPIEKKKPKGENWFKELVLDLRAHKSKIYPM